MFTLFSDGGADLSVVRLPTIETRQPQPITLLLQPPSPPSSSLLPHVTQTLTFSIADLEATDIKVNLPRQCTSKPPRELQMRRSKFSPRLPAITFPPKTKPPGPIARRDHDWKSWVELRVRIVGVPSDISTGELWVCFSRYGQCTQIEIMENSRGVREGIAKVTYRYHAPINPLSTQVQLI